MLSPPTNGYFRDFRGLVTGFRDFLKSVNPILAGFWLKNAWESGNLCTRNRIWVVKTPAESWEILRNIFGIWAGSGASLCSQLPETLIQTCQGPNMGEKQPF